MCDFILASGSESRLGLLKQACFIPKKIIPADIDETPLKKEKPLDYSKRIARQKAIKIFETNKNENILSADTIVICNNKIIQKAKSKDDVKKFMKLFSGKNIKLCTSICFVNKKGIFTEKTVETKIKFKVLSNIDIEDILKYSSSLNCAGGIRIEGFTESIVKSINGSYSNIIGLPLYEIRNIFLSNKINSII